MKNALKGFAVLLLFPAVLASQDPPPAGYEAPGFRQAGEVLPENLRSGPGFTVDERVSSDGYLYLFTIRSKYGPYPVSGLYALKKREYELNVLNELQQFTDSKVFTDAAKEAGIDLVTAPVRLVEGLADAASNPDKTVKTLKKVPAGIAGLFSEVYDQAKEGTKEASRLVSGKASAAEQKEAQGKAAGQGTEIALRYIGYSQKESEWYKRYGLDPYTTNRPLRDKITRIVSVQSAVKLGFKFVPGIGLGSLSWLSTAGSVLDAAESVAVYADPRAQDKGNRGALAAMGVPPAVAESFEKNGAVSPTVKALYVEALKRLSGVEGRAILAEMLARVKTPEGAEFFLRGVHCLAERHGGGEPLVKIMAGVRAPAAADRSGRWIVPLALDYVIWSEEFAGAARDVIKAAGGAPVEARLAGRASPRCRQELEALGVTVKEGVEM